MQRKVSASGTSARLRCVASHVTVTRRVCAKDAAHYGGKRGRELGWRGGHFVNETKNLFLFLHIFFDLYQILKPKCGAKKPLNERDTLKNSNLLHRPPPLLFERLNQLFHVIPKTLLIFPSGPLRSTRQRSSLLRSIAQVTFKALFLQAEMYASEISTLYFICVASWIR
jgi:hypothetical protein